MTVEKSISMSFRVSPRFKQLLQAAAEREHRSLTNTLETLVFDYCAEHGLEPPRVTKAPGKNLARRRSR